LIAQLLQQGVALVVEIQPAHQTELLAQRHLLTSSVVLVVVVVQAAALLLATAAQVVIQQGVVVAVAQGTQSTPVLAATVATAMSVL
jgi:hypothetical protein